MRAFISPENLSEIDFPAYIDQLAAHLFRSYGADFAHVKISSSIGDVRLPIDTAVPCGLIINELVSNSLKYAFPGGRSGEIRIEMREDDNGRIRLEVSDDASAYLAKWIFPAPSRSDSASCVRSPISSARP
jgi:two-component sensor histidine kinase